MAYNYSKETGLSYEDAKIKLKEELKKQGFGVLTEIDVKKTIKDKLGKDFDDYTILGSCNPPFAYEALSKETELGLMLPCNVIVYRKDEKTFVSAINPEESMKSINNPELASIGIEVARRLRLVIDSF